MRFCALCELGTLANENDLDFGIVREVACAAGEPGDGVLDPESGGLHPGVLSREWRMLEPRFRQRSVSKVGRPVAEVVVVHVLVDIRRMREGGRLLRRRCQR